MTIDQLTPMKQLKVRYWLDIIHRCRESGLTNTLWCEQNGVPIKQYYYWLAKIRKLAIADLPRRENGSSEPLTVVSDFPMNVASDSGTVAFVEVTPPKTDPIQEKAAPQDPGAIIIQIRDARIEVTSSTTPEILMMVLRAVKSC